MKFLPLTLFFLLLIALTSCSKDYTEECESFCSKIETCGLSVMMTDCKNDCNTDMSEKADITCQLSFEALNTCFEDNTCADILDEDKNVCGDVTTAWLVACIDFITGESPSETQ